MKAKSWIIGYFTIIACGLGIAGTAVYTVDPFFHYHKPYIEKYSYALGNERSQNDGIVKHFEYDALITGTSMMENFKTSEMDAAFGTKSIKTPFAAASYKEINDSLETALKYNPSLKTIVRGLDMGMFFDASDAMHYDWGEYPTYLYDSNPFNDVEYLFNRDVIFTWLKNAVLLGIVKGEAGITSFDEYMSWSPESIFGIDTVCPNGIATEVPEETFHLTDEEREIIQDNIYKNVISLAERYPDVEFYCFFPPYSAVWWKNQLDAGKIYRQIEAEQYIIELILECENIKLYSFNNRTDITTNINNYRDITHYGGWVNSIILKWLQEGKYMLTKDNYKEYLAQELSFYTSFDYSALNGQEDYESDLYAAALLNNELTGAKMIYFLADEEKLNLSNASFQAEQYNGMQGAVCTGRLERDADSDISVSDHLFNKEYIGAKINVENADDYGYLVFYGKRNTGNGQPSVYVYNDKGEAVAEFTKSYSDIDHDWHQYVIDISDIKGDITIILNGGAIDKSGSEDSSYTFSEICLY